MTEQKALKQITFNKLPWFIEIEKHAKIKLKRPKDDYIKIIIYPLFEEGIHNSYCYNALLKIISKVVLQDGALLSDFMINANKQEIVLAAPREILNIIYED